jgi:hypothetical protein
MPSSLNREFQWRSVTFKISAYNTKTMARWTILHWT